MSMIRVRQAYSARAGEYIELLGSIDATAPEDRDLISSWAASIDGLVADVGCGPEHWTNFLHLAGVEILGVDPVDAFVAYAARRHPHVRYTRGQADNLDMSDGVLGGILAWYSLIHTHPDGIARAFAELARVLKPGGTLLLGYFEGETLASFEHTVVTAWSWPTADLTRRVEDAGFTVTQTHARTNTGSRPHGALVAELTS